MATTLKSLDELLSYSQNLNHEFLCKLLSEAINTNQNFKISNQNFKASHMKQAKFSSFSKASYWIECMLMLWWYGLFLFLCLFSISLFLRCETQSTLKKLATLTKIYLVTEVFLCGICLLRRKMLFLFILSELIGMYFKWSCNSRCSFE